MVWRLLSTYDGGVRAIGSDTKVDISLGKERETIYVDLMKAAQVSTASRIGEDFEFTFGIATRFDRLFVVGALHSVDVARAVNDGIVDYCKNVKVIGIPTGQCVSHVRGNWYVAYRWSNQE